MSDTPEKKDPEVFAAPDVLRGMFSNSILIRHTPEEFLFDFIFMDVERGVLNSRIVISPNHCKRFLKALNENMVKYEQKFGLVAEEIKEKG